ncbi:MAG: hypothetical protein ABR571_07165 [Jatrophihabitans sp.]|uniref:hypothetical protein n=1 Tax=Jatrophihabitans sp. TaxID=1932789 RepID=UPI00391548BA
MTTVPALADDGDLQQPIDFLHNGMESPVSGGVFGSSPGANIGRAICSTSTSTAANANTSCEPNNPHNETSIAVNPVNHNNIIGGVNDCQLAVNPGSHVSETLLSRAHVSFDAGRTWAEYPLNANSAYQATRRPVRRLRRRRPRVLRHAGLPLRRASERDDAGRDRLELG